MTFFYDFNIAPNEEVIQCLEDHKFKGACMFFDADNYDNSCRDIFNYLNENTSLELYHGILISESNPELLRKHVQRYYNKVDLIMVNGLNDKINRVACNLAHVDILNRPYSNKRHCGINHVLASMLVENNITVNIDIYELLHTRQMRRAKLINHVNEMMKLKDKYGFNVIASSSAKSFYDVRSPKNLILLSQLFKVDEEYARKLISDNVSKVINDITIHKESVIDGVRIVHDVDKRTCE